MEKSALHTYHHGNLREALIEEALRVIEAEGAAALSLRDLAKSLGVSHAAPRHHFPDKLALLTAIAAQGYELLASRLDEAADQGFLETGVAYVRFAVDHPGHIRVMYEPSLFRADAPAIVAARVRAGAVFFGSAESFRPGEDSRRVALAGWCLMHGLSTLWLGGNLREAGADPVDLARWLGQATFGAPSS